MNFTDIKNVLAIMEYIIDDIDTLIKTRHTKRFTRAGIKPDLDLLSSILTKFNALKLESVTDEEWKNLADIIGIWWDIDVIEDVDEQVEEMLERLPTKITSNKLIKIMDDIIEDPKRYFSVLSDIKKALKDTGTEEQQELGEI